MRIEPGMTRAAFGFDDQKSDTLEVDRRSEPRYPTRLTLLCQDMEAPEGGCWPGRIRDVSPEGIALEMNRRVEVGAFLRLRVDPPSRGVPRPLGAKVIRATQETSTTFLIGCAFERPLTETEFQTLVPGSWIEL